MPNYNKKWGSKKRPVTVERDEVASNAPYSDTVDATTQASSVMRFEQTERAVKTEPFGSYFTTSDPVIYKNVNKFEGKSSYFHYFPTEEKSEQVLEKFWFEAKNK